ncbi:hypothetical protein SAMN04487769_0834 [Burkholderia sp. b14]|nr:hypothetical protein SAMN04487769_0834 [Burkholderia sp. b14]
MMSRTSALLRLAVQHLMSSSIFMLLVFSFKHDVSRFPLGHYTVLVTLKQPALPRPKLIKVAEFGASL